MTIVLVLVAVPLAAYAAFLLWRVRVEKGWVGRRRSFAELLAEWIRAFAELERALGREFVPIVEAAAAKMAAFVEAFNAPERSEP